MTELSFLVDLLLSEHKLPQAVKKLIAERIKEVESRSSLGSVTPKVMPQVVSQAPSTQRLLADATLPITTPAPIVIPGQQLDKETGRPSIPTGNGTRGPRKF